MRTGADALLAVEEPKITDWLAVWFSLGSGVIAAVALVAAVIAAVATVKTNRNQSKQLERLESAQRREQAALFGVWVEKFNNIEFKLCYQNAGPIAVYDVVCHVVVKEKTLHIFSPGDVGPTSEPSVFGADTIRSEELINSLIEEQAGIDRFDRSSKTRNPSQTSKALTIKYLMVNSLKIRCQFRDANGISWTREQTGKLYEEARFDIEHNELPEKLLRLAEGDTEAPA